MDFTIQHACPQCGASLHMDEADHILQCAFCNVKSFIFSPDYFRYVLPHNTQDKDLIYVPYLRFKGVVYFCTSISLDHRIIDITHIGIELKSISYSLGVRPQAMKLRFALPETKGSFLKFSLKATDILMRAVKLTSGNSLEPDTILHRAFIGETMSLIYLPMYMEKNRLFDGVLNRQIATLPHGIEDIAPLMTKKNGWAPKYISTLCPQCGDVLEGERDSAVFLCRNCQTAWEIQGGSLKAVKLSVDRGRDADSLYIPFWKITAGVKGVDIESFSDFIRITNQPFIVDDARGKKDMKFFSPAFKLRPNFFLNLARQFTILQMDVNGTESLKGKDLFPATLPGKEAIQALKAILASATVTRKNIFPYLPGINFIIKDVTLVYIPFIKGPNEMIHEETGMAINRPSLEFGRRM